MQPLLPGQITAWGIHQINHSYMFFLIKKFRNGLLLALLPVLSACVSSPDYPASQSSNYVSSVASLREVSWSALPGWQEDDLREAWPAWLSSCQALEKRATHPLDWRAACQAAKQVNANQNQAIARYFETHMKVMEVRHANGKDAGVNTGLITGYYEPYLNGSRTKGGVYQTPLHAYPKAWQRKKPSQLPTREKLLASGLLDGDELVWVDDPVAAAFMQIQGSGRIRLTDGQVMRLGFAGTNDHPFQSFAQWLLNRREITRAQATMQGISEWAKKNPSRVTEMLNANPRYVFFKELPRLGDQGPVGALGVPLSAMRSIAVDLKALPLGSPVYLATTYPMSDKPLRRLVLAQDTGTAIVGAVRADFYWGSGDAAGESAGRMKQSGKLWLLLPR
jgi:membrane-bound lytic murein transglycosylase A